MFGLFLEDAAPTGMGGSWIYLIIFGLLLVWIIMSFRKQKKQDREIQEMRDSLSVGDEITTIGGIIGKVVKIKDETVVIETTKDKTKIRFLRSAIRSVDVRASESHPTRQTSAPKKAEEKPVNTTEEAPTDMVNEESAPEEEFAMPEFNYDAFDDSEGKNQ